ncbi:MAG TPA: NAD(P)-binding domain-containing protein [Candidatus Bilamarchaeum sp.]|nr:NAD(P)-binding domain-containing protein [Candidatus Bilamarchaeum sp.]
MKIGIIGTGTVGQAHAARLAEKGHDVIIGTRDVKKTLANRQKDAFGSPPFSEWHKKHPKVKLGTFAEAAAHGEVVINATKGEHSHDALTLAGEKNLGGKILMDISNPLDFSKGMPPSLLVCNTDSLGEQIQRAFPDVRVVKTLNTTSAHIQVDPGQLAGGDHHVFVCGNDKNAKAKVIQYLMDWYGWKNVIDLGDISSARGTEMLLPVWLRLWGALQTPTFNFKIVK